MKNDEHLKESDTDLEIEATGEEAGNEVGDNAVSDTELRVDDSENGNDTVVPESEIETEPGERLPAMEAELAEVKDRLLRTTAEFDNYKKRTQREFEQLVMNATEGLVVKLLPVLDDMKRVLAANLENVEGDEKVGSLYQGLELIQQKLFRILETQGLREIEAVGNEYDVNLHDAMLQVEKEGIAPNQVVEEFETGYYLNEKVIRHAKVVVSK